MLPVILIISVLKFPDNADIIFFILERGSKQGGRTVEFERDKVKILGDFQVNFQH